ncbi:sensor histidine kinase [Haliovirga abyssi]|nr:ATP-binding protein [Haliovirga abyssi]
MIISFEFIFLIVFNVYLKNNFQNFTEKEFREQAKIVEIALENEGNSILKKIGEHSSNRITIIKKDGKVIYDNRKQGHESEMDSHRYRKEVKEALNGKEGFSIRKSNTLNENLLYYSMKSDDYIIRISMEYNIIQKIIDKTIFILLGIFIFLDILYYIIFVHYIKSFYSKKINRMKEILEGNGEISSIYLEDDIDLKEFWEIIRKWQFKNLNNLDKIAEEREKLSKIVSSIEMGIITVNRDGNIEFINNDSEKFMDLDINSNLYYEKINDVNIIKFIRNFLNERKISKEEIFFSKLKEYYILESHYIENGDLYIILLKDITQNRKFEEVQKQFITDISHELKTPLTNIKGYLIALLGAIDKETKEKFGEIVLKNIEKFENIIKDFLNITKIENSKIVNRYDVKINDVIEETKDSLVSRIMATNAKVNYNFNLKNENGYINIDKEKVITILKNLIENGIIYNNKIPEITVNISENESYYEFDIKDNGIGIEEIELKNIFKRFYRIDKARGNNLAGTGLGLAIVNDIISNYKGEIEIESKMGKGTKFKVKLPKA